VTRVAWGRLGLAALLPVLACEPSAVAVRTNAAFSADGGSVLVMEARYDSLSADEPWTDAPSASSWRALFLETGAAALSGGKVLASFDGSPARVKSLARGPLFYVDGAQLVVGLEEGRAVGLQLRTATRVAYALPEERRDAVFLSAERDLRGEVRAVAAVPSPDGQRVAVLHTASYVDGTPGAAATRYVHAVSFHAAADGTHERSAALEAFRDSEASLQLDVPAPMSEAPGCAPVPAYAQVSLLWAEDSGGVFLVASGPGALAVRVDAATGAVKEVGAVPAWPIPTAGGALSPEGKLLCLSASASDPNGAQVRLHALDGRLGEGFFNGKSLPLADAGWAR